MHFKRRLSVYRLRKIVKEIISLPIRTSVLTSQKYVFKTNNKLDAILGTGHTILNRTDKIPQGMVLTLLYFILAWCSGK